EGGENSDCPAHARASNVQMRRFSGPRPCSFAACRPKAAEKSARGASGAHGRVVLMRQTASEKGARESGMSEAADRAHLPWHRGFIRNPQDFYGGVALVGLALIALWASADLPGMRGFAFGPGTAPRLFALVLGGMGVWVVLLGLF